MNGAVPKPELALRTQVRAANASPHTTNRRVIWDCAIGMAVLIYLGVALCVNLYSPLCGLVLIVLAAYEILEPRCGRRGG